MVESKTIWDRLFTVANYVLLSLILLLTLYPCWYVVVASVSDPVKLYAGSKFMIWPRGFSVQAYEIIMKHAMLWKSYGNTLIYVSASTVLGLTMTTLGAFVLSRKYLPGKNAMMMMVTITMFFGGGLIPS